MTTATYSAGVLHVHRSDRTDALVTMLAELVADPLDDPMTPEVVSVPDAGHRTLADAAALGDVWASRPAGTTASAPTSTSRSPARWSPTALARATGNDPKADPWLPERAVWPLMEVVEAHFDEPWLAPLAQHIAAKLGRTGDGASKRFSSVRHVADLFDRYAVHRPDMLQRWAGRARLTSSDEASPLAGRALAPAAGPHRTGPARPNAWSTPAGASATQPDLLDLPPRLSLFGLTRLPASYLDVLDAMARQRDVHLFLLHPSPALWCRLRAARSGRHPASRCAATIPTVTAAAQPARSRRGAATPGRCSSSSAAQADAPATHTPAREPSATATPTLLGRCRTTSGLDRAPARRGAGRATTAARCSTSDDDSIRVHSCHGRGRQVEVLRDAILHLLADDPTLEPRDIIVMCPDIEHFAPLIQATFGAPRPERRRSGDDDASPTSS